MHFDLMPWKLQNNLSRNSAKMSEISVKKYEKNHTVGLVTTASHINQNCALLLNEDYYLADSLAVAHEGFINYIPLVNTMRRCKYVPICVGCDRGKGSIRWMRWMKLNEDTYFVCLSTIGLQFFDLELTDIQFEYDFKELNCRLSMPLGACVLKGILYVGIAMGMIVTFKSSNEKVQMLNTQKIKSFIKMDGFDDCIVTISREELISYKLIDGTLQQIGLQRETLFVFSYMKVFQNFVAIGLDSGEIALYSLPLLKLLIKKKVHEKEITAIDYSEPKLIFLTTSDDLTLKAWKWDRNQMKFDCVYELKSDDDKPFCGIAFTNKICTEFCVVKANSLAVNFYLETQESIESEDSSDEDLSDFYDANSI